MRRIFWQPRYVLLAANSIYRNLETTFEFPREALRDLAGALMRREETQHRELALVIDLDEGQNELCSRQAAAKHGADLSMSVEFD